VSLARAGVSALGLGTALALPLNVAAQEREGHLRVGLRTGYGLPLGHYAEVRTLAGFRDESVNAISDDTYGVVPLWLDLGYWISSRLAVGGYFVFGLVLPKSAPAENPLAGGCPENFDCAATGLRAGVQLEYTLFEAPQLRPWVALGLGYEWVSTDIESRDIDFRLASGHAGPEFLHLQAGADFTLAPKLLLGPFLTLSALQYTGCDLRLAGEKQPCQIDETAWHGWVLFGLRAALDL
jgi:hypothetical protein